jgi:hypothetical protein
MVKQHITIRPPHRLNLGEYLAVSEPEVVIFTRIASHIYDLSIPKESGKWQFLGRIEQKSEVFWAVTYISSRSCIPEYFDDWLQAALFLVDSETAII